MFFSSFLLNPILFSWIYGLCLGLLSGSICLPSLWMIWNEITDNKASTSGILLTGYSLGSVPFSMVFTMIVNPNNTKAEKISDNDRMFPKEVAERVPMTLRWITLSYLICMYIGLALLPRKGKIKQEASQKNLKFTQIIKNKRCWMLFLMMFLCIACQAYAQILYRVVALRYINDDYYSAYVGMAAYICSGIGRSVFGYLFDLFYWKKVMCIVYFFQTVLMSGMWFTLRDKALYAFFMVFYHFLTSSFYNNILLLTDKAFPGDKIVISYICFAFIPAYFAPYFLEKLIEPVIGLGGILGLLAGIMAIMFVLVLLYKDPKNDKVFLVDEVNE